MVKATGYKPSNGEWAVWLPHQPAHVMKFDNGTLTIDGDLIVDGDPRVNGTVTAKEFVKA